MAELNNPPIILQLDSNLKYSKGDGLLNFSVLRPDEFLDAGEFIPSNRPQYSFNEPWKEDEEDGFDIYVDSLHNLPDNCSIVKTVVKIINNKGAL